MQKSLRAQLAKCRARGVPLISITTQDPRDTIAQVASVLPQNYPLLSWDVVQGLTSNNPGGEEVIEGIVADTKAGFLETLKGEGGLVNCLSFLQDNFPAPAFCLALHNIHRAIGDAAVIQALSNSRNWLEAGAPWGKDQQMVSATIILLSPSITLSEELANDVYSLDDPVPSLPALEKIISGIVKDTGLPSPEPETLTKAADALLTLSPFAAKQETALSLTEAGIDLVDLGARRRARINATPGLNLFGGTTTFNHIGGYGEIKGFLTRLFAGPLKFKSIFFLDEIEKALGNMNDSNGINLRQLGAVLSYMADNNTSGLLLHGIPGAGKTAISQACSGEFGIPFLSADLSAMQDSLVGKSEENLRRALETDKSLSQGKSLWIATCNEIERIPAPLLSRFDLATFTFDLPNAEELASIWPIQLASFGLDTTQPLPISTGWTGREIKACCKKSFALGIPVVDAASYVIPLSVSNPQTVERCYQEANNKLLSSSYPGPFQKPAASSQAPKGRAMRIGPDSTAQEQEPNPTIVVVNASPSAFQFSPNPQEPTNPLSKKEPIGF
jgi:hypothetical protein